MQYHLVHTRKKPLPDSSTNHRWSSVGIRLSGRTLPKNQKTYSILPNNCSAARPRSCCFSPQGPRYPPWPSSAPRGERGRRLLPRFLSGSSYLVNFWRHGFLAAGRGMLPCRIWGRPPACLLPSINPVQPPPPDTSPASTLPFLCFLCEQILCVATASALPCQQPVRSV